MTITASRRTIAIVCGLIVSAAAMLGGQGAAAKSTVTMSGTAYEFNNVKVRLVGAEIRIVEYPKLKTVVNNADGSYILKVPARVKAITPYITFPGYSQIHLQTFTTDGKNLKNVNFQTPTVGIATALGIFLDIPISSAGQPAKCVIVSTFSTSNVRNLDFSGFIGYGAHGIAGATASTSPKLPGPIYFNADVLPDTAKTQSSEDGGVIWTNVPSGSYTVKASKPGNRFASFKATCRPGRIVNANPPWGLYQLSGDPRPQGG